MSGDWPTVTIGEIAKVARGGSPRPITKFITNEPDGVNWIKIGDTEKGGRYITGTAEKIIRDGIKRSRWVDEGDFLLTNSMSFGRPYILKTSGCIHDGWLVLKPDYKRIDHDFLYYVLSSPTTFAQFDAAAAGSTVRNLNIGLVEKVRIPLPPLEEQKRIVAVLDQAFAALDRARALAEANLADAMALPQAAIDEIFLTAPESWEQRTLGEVCKFVGGSQPPKTVFEYSLRPGLVRLIQIRDYKTDLKAVYVPSNLAKRFCRADDVMIGRYGPPLFQILRGLEGAYNVALMKAVPSETKVSKDFLFYFLKNSEILRYVIEASSRAAGQAGINKSTIEPYPIAYPALDEQVAIVERLHSVVTASKRAVVSCRQKLEDLTALRQSLLQKAFAGELT